MFDFKAKATDAMRGLKGLSSYFDHERSVEELTKMLSEAYEAGRKDENTRILACSVGTVRNDFYGPGEHPVIPVATFNDSPNATRTIPEDKL